MKNLITIKTIILGLFVIISSQSMAATLILPQTKPKVEEEIAKSVLKKKHIYPQKKPKTKKEEKITATEEKKEDSKDKFIYPLKKPVTVQFKKKIDKALVKSSILSKKDFKIAVSAFEYIDKKMAISFKDI